MLTDELKKEIFKPRKGVDHTNIKRYLQMYRDCLLEGIDVVNMFQYLIDTGMIDFMNESLVNGSNELIKLGVCTIKDSQNIFGIDIKIVCHE